MFKRKFLLSTLLAVGLIYATQSFGALRVFTIPQGGTGTSTAPALNEILIGDGSGQYDLQTLATAGSGVFDDDNWTINGSGQLTPTTTIDLLFPRNATTTGTHYIGNLRGGASASGLVADFEGGAAGVGIIQINRTSGLTARYSIGLPLGQLTFRDEVNSRDVLASLYSDPGAGSMSQVIPGRDYGGNTFPGDSSMFRGINAGTTGTDTIGGDLYIAPGKGNGAGVGSTLYFQTPTQGSSGTTQQSYANRLSINENGITASTSINAGVNSITGGQGTFGSVLVDTLYLDNDTLVSVGTDLNIDNGGSTYFKASSATKASVESTGVHIGIHGGGASTNVPLYLYDNSNHSITFGVSTLTAGGYTANFPDNSTGSHNFAFGGGAKDGVAIWSSATDLSNSASLTYKTGALSVGSAGQSGSLKLYSEQGATDYTATLISSSAMTANSSFAFPPAVPGSTQVMNMDSSGKMGFFTTTGSAGSVVLSTTPTITTPNITTSATITNNNLLTTPAIGLLLTNTTAATTGNRVQVSPAKIQTGQGWATVGPVSKSHSFRTVTTPVTSTTGRAYLDYGYDLNGGGFNTLMALHSNGGLTLGGAAYSTLPTYKLNVTSDLAGTAFFSGDGTFAVTDSSAVAAGALIYSSGNKASGTQVVSFGDVFGTYSQPQFYLDAVAANFYDGNLNIATDNKKLTLGAGADFEMYHDGTNNIFKSNTGYLSLQSDLIFETSGNGLVHGGYYVNNPANFTTTLTSQNTYYELNGTTAWTASPLNLCTVTDPYVTVTKAGVYKIDYSISASLDAANQEIEAGIMLDQTTVQAMGSAHEKFLIAGDLANLSGTSFITLTANQKVSLAVQNITSAGKVITINHANLTITQVGS